MSTLPVPALSRDAIERTEDREAQLRAVRPVVASTSETLRRCAYCKNWRTPVKGRCTHCRQLFGTEPLIGLKKAG